MILTIIIVFFSLIGLILLHEFGHFILAKKFGVKVEEFGIGLPPRLIGKKIGETIYSLNLLPFGAFVKLYGEEDKKKEYWSFGQKPIWQRALIVIGGVVSFWVISAILLSVVMGLGEPIAVSDEENGNLRDVKVQIAAISPDSPAEKAGIKVGDTIKEFKIQNSKFKIQKIKEVQELTEKYKGKKITLTLKRGKEVFDVSLIPRESPPKGEGAMGVVLVRTAIRSWPWYQAPIQGIIATFNLTLAIIQGWIEALGKAIQGLPTGVEVMGPVGIFSFFSQISQLGVNYFLHSMAIISIYLALINILPIPALDGGKLLFLGIEAIRKRPISSKIEQQITGIFFVLLIALLILITIKDIERLF
ncbi:MAG: M50 family metallopeptidase [Patescibacteria group bacterium]|nr:M50 family metallopeptidase [Patescibacteria group bacterium]